MRRPIPVSVPLQSEPTNQNSPDATDSELDAKVKEELSKLTPAQAQRISDLLFYGFSERKRKPRKSTQAKTDAILSVLGSFDGAMSTRQVFYQVVSLGVIQNDKREYESLQRLLVNLRKDGVVPYNRIVDRTRARYQQAGWSGVSALMDSAAKVYRRNYWATQRFVPIIACEKAALEGVIRQVVDEFGAPLWVFRGYPSTSFLFDLAMDIDQLVRDGKYVKIFYFGDCDPSGWNIEDTTVKKLREEHDAEFEWERWGLMFEDLKKHNLIELEVKSSDSRAKAYLAQYGNRSAELDALPPAELAHRVRTAIQSCIDPDEWARMEAIEKEERSTLNSVVGNWEEILKTTKGVK